MEQRAAGAELAVCVAVAASLRLHLRPHNPPDCAHCLSLKANVKLWVRQELARVCHGIPGVQPSRANLKQVSAFMQDYALQLAGVQGLSL